MLDPGQLPEDARKALQAVPEFEPDKHIGKGANGEILLGYHRGIGKRVALKIYYFSEPKEAFDEPQLLCSVNHPNVLPVYDARQVDPHTAVVITQEADGGDLGDLIRSGCSLREAVRILIGVVSGIAALQSPGFSLVHRDLKPENILLGSGQPLIADFGSVKKIPEARGAVSGSKHSILYQPPEAFDPGEYYFNSDLYQAGVVGYELVGGDLPTDATAWLNRKQLREYRASSRNGPS